jgi:uncharacterized protein
MADELISIEIAYAGSERQVLIPLLIEAGANVQQAIAASRVLEMFPEIDLQKQKVGIHSQICSLDSGLRSGQRIEIYRPLLQNPMAARRNKVKKPKI